jgi:DUF4097 and DUF4098 domain-containing protein YvlB
MVPIWVRLTGGLLALLSILLIGVAAAFGALVAGGAAGQATGLLPGVTTSRYQGSTTRELAARSELLVKVPSPVGLQLRQGLPGTIGVEQRLLVVAAFPVSAQQVAGQAAISTTVTGSRVEIDVGGWQHLDSAVRQADRELVISVPPGVAISIQDDASAVTMSGSAGPLTIRTGRGDIVLRDMTVDQPVSAHTGSGAITFSGTVRSGSLDLDSDHGPIELREVNVSHPVHARTGSGEIGFSGTSDGGSLDLSTSQGRIDVSGPLIETSVTAHSDTGGITISGPVAGGSLDLSSSQGSIAMHGVEADRSVQAHAGSGSITFGGTIKGGTVRLDTTQGDITVSLPPDTNAHLTAATRQGSLRIASIWPVPTSQGRAVDAKLGTGSGGSITIQSGSGNIAVKPG